MTAEFAPLRVQRSNSSPCGIDRTSPLNRLRTMNLVLGKPSIYPRCVSGATLPLKLLAMIGNTLCCCLTVEQYFKWFYSRTELPPEKREYWLNRVNRLLACPENASFPRVSNAGRMRDGLLVMHNGIDVDPKSFYGIYGQLLLHCNRGVHEPQEELIFGRILSEQRANAVMLELGAYWSFYSLWFHQCVKGAR